MKTLVSYLLIALLTMQSFGLNAKTTSSFNSLLEHYQLHRVKHNNTFVEFLDLHYGSQKKEHKDEHEEHESLPFQGSQHHHISHNYYFEINYHNDFYVIIPNEQIQHNFNYTSISCSLRETKILQPPKI